MMKKYLLFVFALIFCSFSGCHENPPSMPDGEARLIIVAMGNTSLDTTSSYQPLKNAKVILVSEYGMFVRYTDTTGILNVQGIPSAVYSISVRKRHPLDPALYLVGTHQSVTIRAGQVITDTVHAEPISSSGIAINEIYSSGPVNNSFFFYDQFIELYNSSEEVKYLDGMLVMRVSGNNDNGGKGPGADQGEDGDIDGVTYIFQFPGQPGGKQYPFKPGTFLTIACKALDHTKEYKGSVDLSKADWEFYNQFSATDIDNPNVPNLSNLKATHDTEFLIGLTGDVIVVADGTDLDYEPGIDIKTIIDAVEYQSSVNQMKTLDNRIDKGFVLCPPRYSGKSMQRREPGVDTNNGNLDWEIITPTPGKQ